LITTSWKGDNDEPSLMAGRTTVNMTQRNIFQNYSSPYIGWSGPVADEYTFTESFQIDYVGPIVYPRITYNIFGQYPSVNLRFDLMITMIPPFGLNSKTGF
jgi:hypothetical protein